MNIEMTIIYGIIVIISLFLILGYFILEKNKKYILILTNITVLIINMGYFIISISEKAEKTLGARRMVQFGSAFFMLFMLLLIIEGFRVKSLKRVAFLVCVVCWNMTIWFVEQCIIIDFEFLSIAYTFSVVLLIMFYNMIKKMKKEDDYKLVVQLQENLITEKEASLTNAWSNFLICKENMELSNDSFVNERDEKKEQGIQELIAKCSAVQQLSERERDILLLILQDKRRKDIAIELEISENTVKRHVSHIFSKLEVVNRKELFEKVK